jgi:hypothetical protein
VIGTVEDLEGSIPHLAVVFLLLKRAASADRKNSSEALVRDERSQEGARHASLASD